MQIVIFPNKLCDWNNETIILILNVEIDSIFKIINYSLVFTFFFNVNIFFQAERESSGSGTERNSKIPIIHEYKQRSAGRTAIAPDAPIKQQAWIQEVNSSYIVNLFPYYYNCWNYFWVNSSNQVTFFTDGQHGLQFIYSRCCAIDCKKEVARNEI